MLIRRSALETNSSKDDSNLSLIHRMSLYGLHFSRIWVNLKLNPLEINYINTGILSIINYHLYYIYNKNLYMNILILIVNIIHAYVWYILLLMLFCRKYVYLARMFSSKYLSYIYCILCILLDKTSSKLHCVLIMKFRFKIIDPIFTTCYSKYLTRFGKPSIDHVVLLPVTSTYTNGDKASNTYCSTNNKGAELSKDRWNNKC